jgi:DNA-directed RNA polymerase specialized sigma subunit
LRSIDAERLREERDLFERFRDPDRPIDREILVERFLPLARGLAARYVRRNEPYDDVFQVACIGLVHAIDRYEPARGIAFSSYAVPTIAGEIKRYISQHVGVSQMQVSRIMRRSLDRLRSYLDTHRVADRQRELALQ